MNQQAIPIPPGADLWVCVVAMPNGDRPLMMPAPPTTEADRDRLVGMLRFAEQQVLGMPLASASKLAIPNGAIPNLRVRE